MTGHRVVARIYPVVHQIDEIGSSDEQIDQNQYIDIRGILWQISAEEKEKFEKKIVDSEFVFSFNLKADRSWLDEKAIVKIGEKYFSILGIYRDYFGTSSGVIRLYIKQRN